MQLWKWNLDFTEPSNLMLFEDLSLLCALSRCLPGAQSFFHWIFSYSRTVLHRGKFCLCVTQGLPLLLLVPLAGKDRSPRHAMAQIQVCIFLPLGPGHLLSVIDFMEGTEGKWITFFGTMISRSKPSFGSYCWMSSQSNPTLWEGSYTSASPEPGVCQCGKRWAQGIIPKPRLFRAKGG